MSCKIAGPNMPTGDVEWNCRTHDHVSVYALDSATGPVWWCPVGNGTRPRNRDITGSVESVGLLYQEEKP